MVDSPLMQRSGKLADAIVAYVAESIEAGDHGLDDIVLHLQRTCRPGPLYWALRLALNELEAMQEKEATNG